MELKEEKKEELNELEELEEELLDKEDNVFETLESSQKSWKWISKILMGEAVILGILILAIAGVRYWRNNPMRIAEQYVHSGVRGEWNDVYELLYFRDEENPFLSKKMFVTTKTMDFDNGNIIRVKVKGIKEVGPKSDKYKTLEVAYVRNEEHLTKRVPMIRENGKWLVDGDELYVKNNMELEVTRDAKVSFDGLILKQSLKKETEGSSDLYKIPKVFDGMHYLVLEKENMEKYEDLVRYNEEEAVKVSMRHNEQILKQAGERAPGDVKEGYKKAAKKSESGRTFIKLKLTKNHVSVKHLSDNKDLIEVVVESNYEYRFRENERYYRRRKTERGKCRNVCIYSFDGKELKLEKQELNKLFL